MPIHPHCAAPDDPPQPPPAGPTRGTPVRPGAALRRPGGGVAARIAAMRAAGMSPRAVRRALGLSEREAVACGLADPVLTPAVRPRGTPPPGGRRGPSLMAVADAVTRLCGVPRAQLFGVAQDRRTARVRHLLMYLLRELCAGASFPTIGFFMNRDHSTVIYGVRRVARDLPRDAELQRWHARLCSELRAQRR
jgi:hypothetical protein